MGDSRRIGCPKPHRLIVMDKKTMMYFLVAADSNVSFYPRHKKGRKSNDFMELGSSELFLNNSGAIVQTYGKINCVIDIGLGQEFSWTFNLSNFERPIIGMDFLQHFGLMMNFTKMCLFNPATNFESEKMSSAPCECHQMKFCEDGWPSITGIYTKPIKQRFFVYDRYTKLAFLVGNTSQLSIFPMSLMTPGNKLEPFNNTFEIISDQNQKTKVLGFTSLTLDFGTNRKFVWKFAVVEGFKPIIGLDFLNHFGLVRKFRRGRFCLSDVRSNMSVICDVTSDSTGWPSIVTVSFKQTSKAEVIPEVNDCFDQIKYNNNNYKTSKSCPKSNDPSTSHENPKSKESQSPRLKKDHKKKFAKSSSNGENVGRLQTEQGNNSSNPIMNHRFHITDSITKLQYLVSRLQISMFPRNYVDDKDLESSSSLSEIRGIYGKSLKVFGWTTQTLDFGLGREYSFRFAVVDIEKPILGLDFIRHFKFYQDSDSLIDSQTNMRTAPPSEPCDCRQSVIGWPELQYSKPKYSAWRGGRKFNNFRRFPRKNYSETRAPETRMRSSTPVDGESTRNSDLKNAQLSANFSSESSSLKNESEISIKIMNKSADDSEAELETNVSKETRILESIISEESPVNVASKSSAEQEVNNDQSKEASISNNDDKLKEENFQILVKEKNSSEENCGISIQVTETVKCEINQELAIDPTDSINSDEVKINEELESKEKIKKVNSPIEKMDTTEDEFQSSGNSDSDLEIINKNLDEINIEKIDKNLPEKLDEDNQNSQDSKIVEKKNEIISASEKQSEDSNECVENLENKICELKIEDITNDNSNSMEKINDSTSGVQELETSEEDFKETTEILDNGFSIINIKTDDNSIDAAFKEEIKNSNKEDLNKSDNSIKELETSEEDFKDCSEHFEEETPKIEEIEKKTEEKIQKDDSSEEDESSDDEISRADTAIKLDEDSEDTSEDVSLEGEIYELDVDEESVTDEDSNSSIEEIELIAEETKKIDDSFSSTSESESSDIDSEKLIIDLQSLTEIIDEGLEKKHRFHVMDKNSKILFFVTEKSQVSSYPKSLIQGDTMKDSEKAEFIVTDSSIFPILGWTDLKLDFGLDRKYEWTFAVTDFVKPIIAQDFLKQFGLECDHSLEYSRLSDPETSKITGEFTDDCHCEDWPLLINIQKIDSIPELTMNVKKIDIESCKTPDECSKEKRLILVDQESGLPCLISEFNVSVYPKLYVEEDEIGKFDDSLKILNGDVEIPIYGWIVRKIDFGLGRFFLWKFIVIDINAPIIGNDFIQHYKFAVLRDEGLVFDHTTEKSTSGSEEFYECQTKKYWPDNFHMEKFEKLLSVESESEESEIEIEETEI